MSERGREGRSRSHLISRKTNHRMRLKFVLILLPSPFLSPSLPSPCSIYFSSQSGNYCRGFSALVGFLRSVGCRLSIWFLRRRRGRKGGDTSRPRTTEEVFFLATTVAPSLSAIWCADSFQISFPLLPRRRRRLTLPPLSRVPGRKGTSSYPSLPSSLLPRILPPRRWQFPITFAV